MSRLEVAVRILLGLLERTAGTFAQAFIAALLLANALNLTVAETAALAGVAAALTVPIGALHSYLASSLHLTNIWADTAARVIATFLEAFLAALTVGGDFGISSLQAAATAGVAAALAYAKSRLATLVGNTDTAALLPTRADPATTLAA